MGVKADDQDRSSQTLRLEGGTLRRLRRVGRCIRVPARSFSRVEQFPARAPGATGGACGGAVGERSFVTSPMPRDERVMEPSA